MANTDQEYITRICDICNRLINEKRINIVETKENDRFGYRLTISNVEWYLELDDDIKYNVEINLKNHYKPIIEEAMQDYINKVNDYNKNNDTNVAKRARTE